MTKQKQVQFDLPDTFSADIEFMSILAQAHRLYSGRLSKKQIDAALNWFYEYTRAKEWA